MTTDEDVVDKDLIWDRITEDPVVEWLTPPDADAVTAAADVSEGAMIALVPAGEYLSNLALPGGESEDQLHLTLIYLGSVSDLSDQTQADITDAVEVWAQTQPVVEAEAFAPSVFNPLSDEPCVVLVCGGEALVDAYETAVATLGEVDVEYPEPRLPWIPHVTLEYTDTYDQNELTARTGLIRFDRLRVAFGGKVIDFPLDEALLASSPWPFHMAGKHNQQTHGRGGATPSELAASERLNGGKKLDTKDPEQARLRGAIISWADGGNDGAVLRGEMQAAAGANGDPGADTAGASFMRTIAASPASAPELHRGMTEVRDSDVPRHGDVFELGPTSFTRSTKVRDRFAMHTTHEYGAATTVHIKLKKGSRSLKIDEELDGTSWKGEQEHIAMGKFRVTGYKESRVKVPTKIGKKKEVTLYEIEIEQIPDTEEATTVSTKRLIDSDEWYGN